jgi:hypothetical protein
MTLNFFDERYRIALSYIEEILKEKNFERNGDNYFRKGELFIIVNSITNESINNNQLLVFLVVTELGQYVTSNSTLMKSDSTMENNLSSIDLTLKAMEQFYDSTKPTF